MSPELSRVVAVDRLPPEMTVKATPEECAALAARLQIPAVHGVSCRFTLRKLGAVVTAQGILEADVVQSCVVSLDPVQQRVEDRFTVRFIPEGREASDDPDAPDELSYTGSTIDLGEATSEQLALALDPYPRAQDAELDPAARDSGATPFATLSSLKGKPRAG